MQPKYFDIHTHINFVAFNEDRGEVIKRAYEAGVFMINVGTQKDTSKSAVDLAHKYEGLYACIGLHPIHCDKSFHDEAELGEGGKEFTSRGEEFDYDYYLDLAKDDKVVAIGETGLDYYHPEDSSAIEKQKKSFLEHIKLAKEVGKPLMIHARPSKGSQDAYLDVIEILKEHKEVKANFHFFVGDIETAKKILEIGHTMSFDGPITFAKEYEELIKFLPLESIMVETDAPYATPVPHRGKRNEPAYVVHIANKIADIKGLDKEDVRTQLLSNSLSFFDIKL